MCMNALTSLCGTLVHGPGDRAKNAELLRIFADELDADVGILWSCSGCPLSLGLSWGAHAL
jgi:hypothetical protein